MAARPSTRESGEDIGGSGHVIPVFKRFDRLRGRAAKHSGIGQQTHIRLPESDLHQCIDGSIERGVVVEYGDRFPLVKGLLGTGVIILRVFLRHLLHLDNDDGGIQKIFLSSASTLPQNG